MGVLFLCHDDVIPGGRSRTALMLGILFCCRLLACDMFSFHSKVNHIAEHVKLPNAPILGNKAMELPEHKRLPPLLIINLQLPTYVPSLFGANDGEGFSLVYYFALPEGWEPSHVTNKQALDMAVRLIHDGTEADGCD